MSLPAPFDAVARWLMKAENVLTEEESDPQDHARAADEAREKQELLKVSEYCHDQKTAALGLNALGSLRVKTSP